MGYVPQIVGGNEEGNCVVIVSIIVFLAVAIILGIVVLPILSLG